MKELIQRVRHYSLLPGYPLFDTDNDIASSSTSLISRTTMPKSRARSSITCRSCM